MTSYCNLSSPLSAQSSAYPSTSRYTISSQNLEETYVSQEVCTSVLHEAKEAVRRAESVSVRVKL